MSEWIKFTPSKEHIGLRARFRKVVAGGDTEEVVGTVVDNPDPYPWHYDVAIERDEDKARLYFINGSCLFYQDIDCKRHYLSKECEVEYYYQELE